MTKLVLPELSYKVVGVCMKVHRELGPELLEKYYQRAVALELSRERLDFSREVPVEIRYQGASIGRYFVDFVIERQLVLELKARNEYSSTYFKQVLAYLRQLDLGLGLVVNFRQASLNPERVLNARWSGLIEHSN